MNCSKSCGWRASECRYCSDSCFRCPSLPDSACSGNLERGLYLATVLLTVLAIAELSAPVAYHRMVFRQHKKARLVRTANVLALSGLATVAVSLTGAVLLVASVITSGGDVPLIGACALAFFLGLWLALPLRSREVARSQKGRNVPHRRAAAVRRPPPGARTL